jgi:hypothetical protein
MASGVLELATEVHDVLLKLVAPASPGSIEASSLAPTRNLPLFIISVLAGISFVIFSTPIIFTALGKDFGRELSDVLQIIGGAGLGSSFYALYTASIYIQTSTFDPKYNNTYVIRFVLGLLSGLILAIFLKDFLNINSANATGPNFSKIGVSALALVGGYAAEAVAKILDRVSATLVTLVSGSDKDKIDAAKQKADADAEKKMTQARGDVVKKLQDALSGPDPGAVVTNVQKVMRDILGQ